jgi:phage terminase small subunit
MAPKKQPKRETAGKRNSAKKGLADRHSAFVREYLVDFNGTQAAIRAGYSPRTAGSQAHDLLKKPEIRSAIDVERQKLAEKLEITQTEILSRLWQTATGDVNDLAQVRQGACRFCWGHDHAYQWKTTREYEEACAEAALSLSGGKAERVEALLADPDAFPGMPSASGGFGYRLTDGVNPDCPECAGLGVTYTRLNDSAALGSHPLYEGVKQTQHGIEVKIADRSKAIDQIAKILGLYQENVNHSISEELLAVARAINAASPALTPA